MQAQDSTHPTGVSDDSPRGGKEVARARQRKANAAFSLILAGATWGQVAEVLGFPTERAAKVAFEQSLEKQLTEPANVSYIRGLGRARMERLLRGVWDKATDPENPEHLAALSKAHALVMDALRLDGAVAPSQVVVHNPSQSEIEGWVAKVTAGAAPPVAEPDIFELEPSEYEETTESSDV